MASDKDRTRQWLISSMTPLEGSENDRNSIMDSSTVSQVQSQVDGSPVNSIDLERDSPMACADDDEDPGPPSIDLEQDSPMACADDDNENPGPPSIETQPPDLCEEDAEIAALVSSNWSHAENEYDPRKVHSSPDLRSGVGPLALHVDTGQPSIENSNVSEYGPSIAEAFMPIAAGDSGKGDVEDHSAISGVCGLINLGNTCFMSAGLQCLLNTPPIAQYCFNHKPEEPLCSIANTFSELIHRYWSGKYSSLRPSNFKEAFGVEYSEFRDYRQHDCQEFLTLLLPDLRKEMTLNDVEATDNFSPKNADPLSTLPKQSLSKDKKPESYYCVDTFSPNEPIIDNWENEDNILNLKCEESKLSTSSSSGNNLEAKNVHEFEIVRSSEKLGDKMDLDSISEDSLPTDTENDENKEINSRKNILENVLHTDKKLSSKSVQKNELAESIDVDKSRASFEDKSSIQTERSSRESSVHVEGSRESGGSSSPTSFYSLPQSPACPLSPSSFEQTNHPFETRSDTQEDVVGFESGTASPKSSVSSSSVDAHAIGLRLRPIPEEVKTLSQKSKISFKFATAHVSNNLYDSSENISCESSYLSQVKLEDILKESKTSNVNFLAKEDSDDKFVYDSEKYAKSDPKKINNTLDNLFKTGVKRVKEVNLLAEQMESSQFAAEICKKESFSNEKNINLQSLNKKIRLSECDEEFGNEQTEVKMENETFDENIRRKNSEREEVIQKQSEDNLGNKNEFQPQLEKNDEHQKRVLYQLLLKKNNEKLSVNERMALPSTSKGDSVVTKPVQNSEYLKHSAEKSWNTFVGDSKSAVIDTFYGQFKNSLVCSVCGHTSVTFASFSTLSVPLPHANEVQITVIYVSYAKKTPIRFLVTLPKVSTFLDLKLALLKLIQENETHSANSGDLKLYYEESDKSDSHSANSRDLKLYLEESDKSDSQNEISNEKLVISPQTADKDSKSKTTDATAEKFDSKTEQEHLEANTEEKNILIAEVLGNHISKIIDDSCSTGHLISDRKIYAFEILQFDMNELKQHEPKISESESKISEHSESESKIGSNSENIDKTSKLSHKIEVSSNSNVAVADSQPGCSRTSTAFSCATSFRRNCPHLGDFASGVGENIAENKNNAVSETQDFPKTENKTNGDAGQTCNICLDRLEELDLTHLKTHDKCVSCSLCDTCIEMACKHHGDDQFPCPVCQKLLFPTDMIPLVNSPKSRILSVPVVFRKDTDSDDNNKRDSNLFGHPRLLSLPSRLPAQGLKSVILDKLGMISKKFSIENLSQETSDSEERQSQMKFLDGSKKSENNAFDILLVNGGGLKCSRCDFHSHCRGCDIFKCGTTDIKKDDTLCVRFKSVSSESEVVYDVCRMTDDESYSGLRDSTPLTIYDCLNAFTQSEKLENNESWFCPKCQKKVDATKTISVWKFPPYLIIHLERFDYSKAVSRRIDDPVVYPLDALNLSPYVTGDQDVPLLYNLYGVVCHMGSAQAGHYTAIVRSPVRSEWLLFNDDFVSKQKPRKEEFSTAYILFYYKQGVNFKLEVPLEEREICSHKPAQEEVENIVYWDEETEMLVTNQGHLASEEDYYRASQAEAERRRNWNEHMENVSNTQLVSCQADPITATNDEY